MALAHQPVICLADRSGRGAGQDSEDRIGIFARGFLRADMECSDAGVIGGIKAKMLSDFAQIGILGREDAAIGESNMEQPAEKIFEHRPIIGKQTADLAGVALIPGGTFSGEVEDQPDMPFLTWRDLKYFAKSGDLVVCLGAGSITQWAYALPGELKALQ